MQHKRVWKKLDSKLFFAFFLALMVLFSLPALAQVTRDSTDLVLNDGARIEVYYSNVLAQEVRIRQNNLIVYSNELIDLGNGRTKWNLKFDRSSVRFLDELKVDISGVLSVTENKIVTPNFIIDFSDAKAQGYGVVIQQRGNTATITFSGIAAFGDGITIDPTIIDTSFQPIINYGNVLARDSTGNIWHVFAKDTTSANKDIWVAKSTNGGSTFTTFNLTNTTDFNEAFPKIDVNAENGLVIIYDKYFSANTQRQVFATTCSTGGCDAAAEFLSDINVSQCALTNICGNSYLTIDQNNISHITYGRTIAGATQLNYRNNSGYVGVVGNWSAEELAIPTSQLGGGAILFNNAASGAPDGTGVIVSKNGSGRRLAWASANASQFWVSYYNGTAWQGGLLLASGTIDTPPSCYAGYDKNFYCTYAQDSGSGSVNEQLHFRQANQDNNSSAIANWSTDANISRNGLNLQLSSIMQAFDLNVYVVGSQVPTNAPVDTNIYLFTRLPNGTFKTSTIADQNRFFNDANFLFNPLFRDKDYNGSTVRFPTSVFTGTQRYRLDYIFSTSNANTGNPHTFVFDSNALNLSDINGIIAVITPSIASPLTLDTDEGISNRRVDFNSTSSLIGIVDVNYRWFVNTTNVSTDQNYSRDFNGANADYNVSLVVQGRSQTQTFTSQADLNYLVRNLAQGIDINFVFNPTSALADVNFTATISSGIISYVVWGFPNDQNQTGNPVNKQYRSGDLRVVCAVVNTTGDVNKVLCENFYNTFVFVKRPINISTAAIATPYSVTINSIPTQTYNNISVDQNFWFFYQNPDSNTYNLVVDANVSYYVSTYLIHIRATDFNQTIQPYVVPVTTGIQVTFTSKDGTTNNIVPNIFLFFSRNITGTGNVLVASGETDTTGRITLPFIPNVDHNFTISYPVGTIILIGTYNPVSSDATNGINVFIPTSILGDVNSTGFLDVNFFQNLQVPVKANNTVDLNQEVTATHPISTITITVDHNGTVLFNQTYSGVATGGDFNQNVNVAGLNRNVPLTITYDINFTDGSSAQIIKIVQIKASGNIIDDFANSRSDLGDMGGTMLLSVFLITVILGGIHWSLPSIDNSITFLLASMIFLFLTLVGWVDGVSWIIGSLAGGAMWYWGRVEK